MSELDFSTMRAAMVASQLRTNAVSDPRVVAAMEAVAREKFVPDDRRPLAYIDVAIPLGQGRALSAPLVTGRLIVEAGARAGDKVLLIGAATGYATALLAELGAEVVAVEESAALFAKAQSNLGGLAGVELIEGALNEGAAHKAPYDIILIDGAVEQVPETLWVQLREGGTLATGVVDRGVTRLATGRRVGSGGALVSFVDIEAAVLPGFAAPRGFSF